MKQLTTTLMTFIALSLFSLPATADEVADQNFARKFMTIKAKNRISTLKTAEFLAQQYKKTTDQILNRFISAQFSHGKNAELAVVYGLEAFQEQGHSFDQALTKVSDLTGQMTSTLEAMNNSSRQSLKRETASAKKKSLASR